MGKFNIKNTGMEGLLVIEPTVFGDERGYFMETFNSELVPYVKHLDGSPAGFVQDNQSRSKKGVLRGLHFQKSNPQGKLVRVIEGQVYDVAVDLREGSETYGKWHGVLLSGENKLLYYIPEGFAHGFAVYSDYATFSYKCTRPYCPDDEGGIMWDDADIGIDWCIPEGVSVLLSEKDKHNGSFKDFITPFKL